MSDDAIPTADLLGLLETNKRLVALGEKQKMLDYVLDQAVRITGAERGFIIFHKGDGFEAAAARSFDREDLRKVDDKFSRTVLKQVMETGEPLITMEAGEDARLKDAESVMKMKLRSILCVAIRIGERALGALYLDNRFTEGAFQESQVRLVSLFADQAALALNAIDSLEESRRHAEETEKLQRQLAIANESLEEKVVTAEKERDRVTEILGLTPQRQGFEGIVGSSKGLRDVMKTILRLKESEVTIFIHGESGTGKELIARAIHRNSKRKEKPFVAINCAAFSEQLLDSELFGHVRGAFTGADRDRMGLFEEAEGGTLFLDEIGEMGLGMQAKLLRVIQEREIRPVGANAMKKVDVRIVSASIKDLQKMVQEKRFREDLYFRLHVMRISLPPLRDRREDIPELVQYFMKTNSLGLPTDFLEIDPEAMKLLTSFDWPGNVRELQNEISRCLALGRGHITANLISPEVRERATGGLTIPEGVGLDTALKDLERRMILKALEECRGNKSEAAERLKISRVKLYQKARQYGLSERHGRLDAQKIRAAVREAGGNRTLAAKRLGLARRTLYEHLKRNS